jgi:hypothetical protein
VSALVAGTVNAASSIANRMVRWFFIVLGSLL